MLFLGGFLQGLAVYRQPVQIQPELPDFFQGNLGGRTDFGKLQKAVEVEIVIPDGQLGAVLLNLQVFQELG